MRKKRHLPKRAFPLQKVTTVLKKSFFILVIPIVMISFMLFMIIAPWPVVTKIKCTLNQSTCPLEVTNALQQNISRINMLTLNKSRIATVLNKKFPTITLESVAYHLPHTLDISLYQNPPFARVVSQNQEIIVDKDGIRLEVDRPQALNITNIISQLNYPKSGNIRNIDTTFAINLASYLERGKIKFSEIMIDLDGKIIVNLSEQYRAIFSSSGSLSRQVTTLQLILNSSTMKPELPVIDLRFDKPILKPQLEG